MRAGAALAVTSILALSGCSALDDLAQQDVDQITGPNGRLGYVIECDQWGRSTSECFSKAGQLCAAGYDIVDRVSQVRQETDLEGNITSYEQNSLVIECK